MAEVLEAGAARMTTAESVQGERGEALIKVRMSFAACSMLMGLLGMGTGARGFAALAM
jgi:hypothetical protein